MSGHRTQSRGFALVLTLMLLALAAVALSHLGRQSLRHALDALEREREVQRDWAVRSVESTLLPRASQALWEAADHDEPAGPARVAHQLTLAEFELTLVFTDEQAKVNANELLARYEQSEVQRRLSALAARTREPLELSLRPLEAAEVESTQAADAATAATSAEDETTDEGTGETADHSSTAEATDFESTEAALAHALASSAPLTAYGQLGGSLGPERLLGRRAEATGLADLITLWGSGAVHYRRARPAVLEAVLRPELGRSQIDQFVRMRDADPEQGLGRMLNRMGLSASVHRRVQERLTEGSDCHGLWIVIDDGQRTRAHLSVRVSEEDAPDRTYRLSW